MPRHFRIHSYPRHIEFWQPKYLDNDSAWVVKQIIIFTTPPRRQEYLDLLLSMFASIYTQDHIYTSIGLQHEQTNTFRV